jgi:hypothetical protein
MFILPEIELYYLDYRTNNTPEDAQIEEIAKQWKRDDLRFFLCLDVSIVFLHLADNHICLFSGMVFFVVKSLTPKLNNDDRC